MRRKDREMDKNFALDVLKKSPYVVLSLTDENNNPYCIPISIVLEENHLYFHCAMEGKKIDLLKNNNQICICAVSRCRPKPEEFTMEFESAVLYGKAEEGGRGAGEQYLCPGPGGNSPGQEGVMERSCVRGM